ncbi:hypothetical protein GUJ93_ZPchr0070g33429 [Zizania palustris]|uniref:GBF-interacting protein 1 N-terminal domain-containing protein n=1 Tax=Zizania palustris TaxID=103762 RepID=A0A8J5V0H6_ZIZPA|nr:hypothetical protein GUJ93_ZPchr0070g33429 [Zizania palustris]
MRGGGRGGGGRVPYAAAERADAAAIPLASRKLVQGLKGILADRSEAEIYATLLDCGMDPDVAVERLISQDHFHEVKRKRDKKRRSNLLRKQGLDHFINLHTEDLRLILIEVVLFTLDWEIQLAVLKAQPRKKQSYILIQIYQGYSNRKYFHR